MKKMFCIRDFAKANEVDAYKALIVAFKSNGVLNVKNLTCDPESRMKVGIDPKTDEVVIRFKLFDNEFLGLGDAKGVLETRTVKRGEA